MTTKIQLRRVIDGGMEDVNPMTSEECVMLEDGKKLKEVVDFVATTEDFEDEDFIVEENLVDRVESIENRIDSEFEQQNSQITTGLSNIKTIEQNISNKVDTEVAKVNAQLSQKVKYITPQFFGAKGDGVTDDSDAFKKFIEADGDKLIPSAKYIIACEDKLKLTSMRGIGSVQPQIIFTHKEGGFKVFGTEQSFTSFGFVQNIAIYGNHMCDVLIDIDYNSEGAFDNVRFGYCKETVFKIKGIFELVRFDNCIVSDVPIFIKTENTAMKFSSINGITLNGGNYWMVDELIQTVKGGNLTITGGAWLEKTNILLKNSSTEGFTFRMLNSILVHTTNSKNLIDTNANSTDVIFLENNDLRLNSAITELININTSSSTTAQQKIISITNNTITGSSNLLLLTKLNGVSNKYNIYVFYGFNNLPTNVSFYGEISNAFDGATVSGITDVKKGMSLFGKIYLKDNDYKSLIAYDGVNRVIYTTDDYNINKYNFQIARDYLTINRPKTGIYNGTMIFDANLQKPIWWTGSRWVDATGTTV